MTQRSLNEMLLCILLLFPGCTVEFGPKQIPVCERYPIYPMAIEPRVETMDVNEMTPFESATNYAQFAMADGIITEEEKKNFYILLESAGKRASRAQQKIMDNLENLIIWGKQNEATLESYNDYADKRNREHLPPLAEK